MLLKIYTLWAKLQDYDDLVKSYTYEITAYTAEDALTQIRTELEAQLHARELKFYLITNIVCGRRVPFENVAIVKH